MSVNKGIYAICIALQIAHRLRVHRGQIRAGRSVQPDGAKIFVNLHSRALRAVLDIAKQFGKLPVPDMAIQFHLPQPILRMDEAESEDRILQ